MIAPRFAKDFVSSVLAPSLSVAVLAASVLPAALPAVFAGGGTRPWRRGRVEDLRAAALEAKDAAAAAFYELDTAQRDLRIALETIGAADDSPQAARMAADFATLSERADNVSAHYITVVDAHDLDSAQLDADGAHRARQALTATRTELQTVKGELARFGQRLEPLQMRAESQLARVTPAVERARQALRAATEALDGARGAGMRAEEPAAALAALGPELRLLNEGAGRHGVQATIRRAEDVSRRATALAAEVERLPERAGEIDRRLSSLRTRADAIANRAEQVEPVLSELRRRFTASCWQDLQHVPEQAAASVGQARELLAEAGRARAEQRFGAATDGLTTVHGLLGRTDEAVGAARERLRLLDEVAADPSREIERTQFAVRDAQRLAMAGRSRPDPRHARPLDAAAERLERAVAVLEGGGRHPDYWVFLTETRAVRGMAAGVVEEIRTARG